MIEVVRESKKLEWLCLSIKLCEEERVYQLMEVVRPDMAMSFSCGTQPTTVVVCYERVLCAKYRLGQLKEEKAEMLKPRENKTKKKRIVDQELPNLKKKIERSGNKKKIELTNPKNKTF